MTRKTIAIIIEIIPIIAAVLAYVLILSDFSTEGIRGIVAGAVLVAFLGFVFRLIGHKVAGSSRTDQVLRILGILDWLATLSIVGLYAAAIFSFGL